MMPPGAADSRTAQKMALAGVVHEREVDSEIGRLLEQVEGQAGDLDKVKSAVLREAKRECGRLLVLSPPALSLQAATTKDARGPLWWFMCCRPCPLPLCPTFLPAA